MKESKHTRQNEQIIQQPARRSSGAIRAGRANPHVLDKITVDYYGTPTPLQQVGNITVPEAAYVSDPALGCNADQRDRAKPSMTSDLSASTPPTTEHCIRLVFPELTEERRKDLVKEVKKKGEGAKVAVRNIRRDANDAFKKAWKGQRRIRG